MLNIRMYSALWWPYLLALISGVSLTFSLSPYNIWIFAIVSPAILNLLIRFSSRKRAYALSFLFGLGLYGSGTSWVYVSIHDFGYTPVPLAIVMTSLFVIFLALVFTLPFIFYTRYIKHSCWGFIFGFSSVWVIGEWLKTWLFTGFPWLFVGYAHLDTPLSAWAPLGGVFAISFMSILSGVVVICLCYVFCSKGGSNGANENIKTPLSLATITVCVFWLGAFFLNDVKWTEKQGASNSLAILQPNIELEKKWDPFYHPEIMEVVGSMASEHWDKDIQVWPEAAVPTLYHDALYFYDHIDKLARESDTHIFTGVLYDETDKHIVEDIGFSVYNTMIGLGKASGIYHKQRLVPFGEYVPFEKQLRGLIAFFDLPNSVIRVGPYLPEGLSAQFNNEKRIKVAPFICYEIVYPDLVAAHAKDAELLLTVSNDAWFGDSIGPLQHFQMARMRALENQKYLIRATNTGISAIIDADANVLAKTNQFERTTLLGEVYKYSGSTPFNRFGSIPILILSGFLIFVGAINHRKHVSSS